MTLTQNEFVESKINTKFLKCLTLILLFVLLYGINNAYVYYTSLIPFGVSLVFALLFIGFNGYVLSGLYVISILCLGINTSNILQGANVLLVLSLFEYIHTKKMFAIKKWHLCLLFPLSLISYVIGSLDGVKENLALLVSIILGFLFLYGCVVFLDATIGKGLLGKINLDEKICGAVILIVFSVGICNGVIGIVSIALVFASIIVLVINRLYSSSITILCGVLIGIGFSIYHVSPINISMLVVMSVSAISFKCRCKYLSAIAWVLSYILFTLVFNTGFVGGNVLSVVLGCIVYLLIPTKLLTSFSDIFVQSSVVSTRNIFNNGKNELIARIRELSVVFSEMDKVYRDMVKGNLSDSDAKSMLKDELVGGVCINCSNRDRCFRDSSSFMESCISSVVDIGYDKGKIMLIDLPEYLTTNCYKVSAIVQYFNNLISSYQDYQNAVNNIDTGRVLIADQLGGVSRLLDVLSKEVDINISANNNLEEIIKERLGYAGILCLECVVYEKDINNKTINLIVKKSTYIDNKLIKIVNKALKSKYYIASIKPSVVVGAMDIVLKNSPNYDIVFGSSSISKNGKIVSGDSHSVIPINDGRYLVSICDGMGSGKEASTISKLTLSLIENFYKAGFDNETILSSINKLLSLNEQDKFSTIDLCVIDGKKNIYDFIKLGATNGYLKRSNGEVEVISSSGLPVGVLENIVPHITKLCISAQDIIVLVSDGVSDILGDELYSLITTLDTINPQTLSEEILSASLDKVQGQSLDDMTVVCVRVFESV